MGVRFHLLAAWLETGLSLEEALAREPGFLPPQVTAMLRAGRQLGDLTKVLPASRKLLSDATSQTRGAMNYLLVVTFVITPTGFSVFGLLSIFVIPKFMEVFAGMNIKTGGGLLFFLAGNMHAIILIQCFFLLVLWLAVFIYIGGPRLAAWFPPLERWQYHLPWRQRRMQRDFSHVLALLLDGGLPEAEALKLAAACSANAVFRRRADRALAALQQGVKLPEAVQAMDDSGEFRWRLRNAAASHGGFLRALAGWHESLDARAFQLEQAAAHGITTALVIWSGLFVGSITVAVFMIFTSLINSAVLW
jgi:type IV pilus assembly protein PilC